MRKHFIKESVLGGALPAAANMNPPNMMKAQNEVLRLRLLLALAAFAIGASSISLRAAAFSDANWISMGGIPGPNGAIRTVAADGLGNIYIGGDFSIVGDVFATNIAKWNGSKWSAVGSGIDGSVMSLLVSGGNLYAGGRFTTAGGAPATNIAKWNGSNWSGLGQRIGAQTNLAGYVSALAISGGDLYAGGNFTMAGGSPANYVAKWNGNGWSALAPGVDYIVQALAVSGGNLYAGGSFTNAGAVSANHIAKWNGSSWSALGSGTDAPVNSLALLGSDLYTAGYFQTAGGVSAAYVARWDGSNWSATGPGILPADGGPYYDGSVNVLTVSGNDLYAVGHFGFGEGNYNERLLKWTGTEWSAFGLPADASVSSAEFVSALVLSGDDLYTGGPLGIAKWNGSTWSAVGSGTYHGMSSLACSGSNLYAGGFGVLSAAGGLSIDYIAQWNGESWSPVGAGVSGNVRALAVSGSNLYAGGDFKTAGGRPVNRIAKWDGSDWSALGSGMDGAVTALAVSGNDLYAAGGFTTAGGVPATNIAKWNGNNWSPLGLGLSSPAAFGGTVYALAILGNDLFAGGTFTMAGGLPAKGIAKWNGSSWSSLGSGMTSLDVANVLALAVLGNDLYVGGVFTNAGGVSANYVAKWNGSSWSALGSGMDNSVLAMAVSGSDLYAGGYFTTASGVSAIGIAKWNGSAWSGLGSGLGGAYYPLVDALAVSSNDLYVGGYFETAGGKVSASISRLVLGDAPGHNQLKGTGLPEGKMQFSYIGYPGARYALERAFNLSPPISWVGQQTNTMTVSGVLMFTNPPVPATNNFWRVRALP